MISASDRKDLEDAERLLEEVGYTDPDLLANAAGEPWARIVVRLSYRLELAQHQVELLQRQTAEQTSWLTGWIEGSDRRAVATERQIELLWQQIRLLRIHTEPIAGPTENRG